MKKIMRNKIYISQIDETDCGIAALTMLFKHFGTRVSLAKVRNTAKIDQMETTALGLVKTAEKFNFETKAIKADMSLFEIKDLPFLFITHVIKEGEFEHYYVVIGATEKHVENASLKHAFGKGVKKLGQMT